MFVSGVNYDYKHVATVEVALATRGGVKKGMGTDRHLGEEQAQKFVDSGLLESKTDMNTYIESNRTTSSWSDVPQQEDENDTDENEVLIIPGKCFFDDGSVFVGELDVLGKTMHGTGILQQE